MNDCPIEQMVVIPIGMDCSHTELRHCAEFKYALPIRWIGYDEALMIWPNNTADNLPDDKGDE